MPTTASLRRAAVRVATIVCTAFICIAPSQAQKSPEKSLTIPVGAIQYGGYAVNPSRVLVRWKSVPDQTQASSLVENAMRTEDAQALSTRPTHVTSRLYSQLGGVGLIEFADVAAWQEAIRSGEDIVSTSAGSGSAAPTAAQLKSRIAALQASGLFAYVEPDYVQTIYATPTDAAFTDGRLWGLRNTGQSGGTSGIDTQAVSAWDVTTGSTNVIVAVIDTGIRYTHNDLAGNMWHNPGETANDGIDNDGNGIVDDVFGFNSITGSGDPLDDNGHGSHCSGTIGGTANDAGDTVGVSWVVRLMGLKFLSAEGSGNLSNAITCIDYAISKGANIISGSYGGGGYSQATSDAIERARQAGILCVFAAGNESNDNDANPAYPASYSHNNIVSVAAVDRTGALANFSNYGATNVDLAAPGVQIFSCNFQTNSSYQTISGTSMATPHVAGVAALLKAAHPSDTYSQLRERLLSSTKPLPSLQGRVATGGLVQARAAIDIQQDGIMEVALSVDPSPARSGESAVLALRVTDLGPVTGATVTGTLGSTTLVFQDTGIAPDARSGDGIYTVRTTIPAVTSGDLMLSVSAAKQGKTTFSGSFTIPYLVKATNDNFASAATLDPASTPLQANNRDCSKETGEPAHAGNSGGRSVWWTWTAPSNGEMQLSTVGSSFDTLLAVYTGSDVAALTPVVSNDDEPGGSLQSAATFDATSGTTYLIAVDGYSADNGDIVLSATFASTGGGDTPPSFVQQPGDVRVQQGETITLTAEVAGTPTPTLQWSVDGTDLTNGGRVSGATSAQLVITNSTATDGGNYKLTAQNSAGTATSLEAHVTVDVALVRPPNDDFADRTSLVGTSAQASGVNTGATAQTGEPAHASIAAHRSVWWVWTAPQSGPVAVDTFGSAIDTVLAVYRGSAVNALSGVASNNDAPGSRQSRVTFTAEAGLQYSIAVDSAGNESGSITLRLNQGDVNGSAPTIARQPINTTLLEGFAGQLSVVADGSAPLSYQWWKNGSPIEGAREPILPISESQTGDSGTYFVVISNPFGSTTSDSVTIAVTATERPPNDDFAQASVISAFGEFVIARLTGATRENGEQEHAGGTGGTLWWTWSPDATGSATITTDGSFTEGNLVLDTTMSVYTGSTLAGLTLVAENDDTDTSLTSEVTFDATAGVTYHIAVGGYAADDVGIVLLEVPDAAVASPNSAPRILSQPLSDFVSIGDTVYFFAGFDGVPTADVQWQRSTNGGSTWSNIQDSGTVFGSNTFILELDAITESQNGELYRAQASNSAGSVTTISALLGVLPKPPNDDFADAFTISPGVAVVTGRNYGATLETSEPEHAGVGFASVWWTWQASFNGTASFDTIGSDFDTVLAIYSGSSLDSLVEMASNDDEGDSYQSQVEFSAVAGTTYHIAVSGYGGAYGSVKLQAPSDVGPDFTLEPLTNVPVTSGGTVTITAGATGSPTPSFQWERSTNGGGTWNTLSDGGQFSGTTSPTLVITAASGDLNGQLFRVVVSNSVGTVTSAATTLDVTNPSIQMVNIATRAISLGGSNVIIPGFVISGTGTKRVLVRAVGPKLQDFGISQFLPDPELQVFRAGESTPFATNDNWVTQEAGRPDPAVIGAEVGAFSLDASESAPTADTLSAAIVLDLEAGAYSTIARDVSGQTGIGIVEVYDDDDANTGGPRLVNVANRGFVGTGSQVMIPGFVVTGNGARRYLVRAVGPKLADFGLPANTLLADPRVSVMQGSTTVASNDDWVVQMSGAGGTSSDVEAVSKQIGAFALGPGAGFPTDDQKSAALLVWLEPGAYTVVVSGTGGGTGTVIAEVYEVP